ncbi:MAG: hypothetical protein R6T92_03040 [Desulfosalsimonadaceae bacterium]
MLVANTYEYSKMTDNAYRIMTLKLTGEEVASMQFALRREINRLQAYILDNPKYGWRDRDIANLKTLKSLLEDLHDGTIKP